MTTFFCTPCENFTGEKIQFTIATALVICNREKNKILMIKGQSTEKWQFIGGRYDDKMSFRENAENYAEKNLGHKNTKILNKEEPILLFDTIDLK